MTKYESYFKWAVILVIAILFFIWGKSCNGEGGSYPTNDTIQVRIDTVWKESKRDTEYVPKIVKEYIPKPIYLETEIHDTIELDSPFRDSIIHAYAMDYLKGRLYQDTVRTEYGYLAIKDSLARNKIQSRKVSSNFNFPTVKEIITLREEKRTTLYLGGGLIGNQVTPIFGAQATAGLLFKNGKYYGTGVTLNKTGDFLYNFNFSLPIKTRK